MIKILNEFKLAWVETKMLKKKYHTLTSCIGLLGVFTGGVIWILTFFIFDFSLGIKVHQPIKTQTNGYLLMLSLLLLPFIFYLFTICWAGLLSFILYKSEKITKQEAFEYTFFSRYPKYWLEKKYNHNKGVSH